MAALPGPQGNGAVGKERKQSAEGSNDEKTGNLRTGESGLRKTLCFYGNLGFTTGPG